MDEAQKTILLGEAPSRGGDRYHHFPLSGPPARVLCTLSGIPSQEDGSTYGRWTWALYERFECRNLFERYAQAEPWSVPRARDRAREIERALDGRVVVCLGRRVQAAVYDALDIPREYAQVFHSWVTRTSEGARPNAVVQVVAIPHPSGLNRALNDPVERERCGETLRAALDLAAGTRIALPDPLPVPPRTSTPVSPRFWAKVEKSQGCWRWTGSQGCWRWTGSHLPDGYGHFIPTRGGPSFLVHRFAYEEAFGPIPEGYHVHHLCETRDCVRPEHLQAVTPAEHVRLTPTSITGRLAAQTECLRGHEFTPENTETKNGRRECIACRLDRNARRRAAYAVAKAAT